MGLYLTSISADQSRPATSAKTSVAQSATSVSLLAANLDRRFVTIFNEANATLYVSFGATASLTSYTVQIPKNGYFESQEDGYTGAIDGIWTAAGAGNARITEVTN